MPEAIHAMPCPSDDSLVAFAEGFLGEDSRERVEAHLDACAVCRVVVAAASDTGPRRQSDHAGRYRLGAKLGEGGMGVVFAATDPELRREVAIKVLHPDLQRAHDQEARVIREARALARLAHPNVLAIFDVGRCDAGVFIAMELVDGPTLRRWWKGRAWPEVLACLVAAGRGLAAAHAHGLIHRDFKPENVLIGSDGRPRVSDFGLAAALDGGSTQAGRTTGGQGSATHASRTRITARAGTPAYMAPEVLRGQGASEASDQYSFCAALFEAMYGCRPRRRLGGPVDSPPSSSRGPAALRGILRRGLSPDPADRFESMPALLQRLEALPGRRTRRPWILGATAATAVGLMVASGAAPTGDDCDRPDATMVAQWTPAIRTQLRARIGAAGDALAMQSADRIDQRIAGFTEAWTETRVGLCEAMREEGSVGVAPDRGMRCLDQQRHALRGTVAVLLDDATPVQRANDITAGLPLPQRCADPQAIAGNVDPPSPAVDAEVRRLQAVLARAEALLWAARAPDALAAIDHEWGNLRAVSYPPVMAQAMVVRGACLAEMHEADAAPEAIEAAYDYALQHRIDDAATRSALLLMKAQSGYFGRLDEAERWGRHAKALCERTSSDLCTATYLFHHARLLVARSDHAQAAAAAERAHDLFAAQGVTRFAIAAEVLRGTIAQGQQQPAAAQQYYEAGMDALVDLEGWGSPALLEPLTGLLNIALAEGELDDAESLLDMSDAIIRATHGTDHPRYALNLLHRSSIAEGRGDADAALAAGQGALARLGGDAAHPQYAYVAHARIARAFRMMGDYGSAHDASRHALEACEAYSGLSSDCAPESLNHLAWDELHLRRYPQAVDHYRQAIAAWEALLGRDTALLAYPLYGLGRIEAEHGNWTESRALLERALAADEPDRAMNWPATAFELARAIWSDPASGPRERTRAVLLAEQAAETLAHGPGSDDASRAVTGWLETL